MIDILTTKYPIDPDRIFLTGYSNGAWMTFRAVCELGNKIRGAVPYAGGLLFKKLTKQNSAGKPLDKNPLPLWSEDTETFHWNENVSAQDWMNLDESYFTLRTWRQSSHAHH